MALIRLPDTICYNCKRPTTLTYHEDGSVRSAYCFDCPNRPPGPASYPHVFPEGKFRVESTKEGLRAYPVQARIESEIRAAFNARMIAE